MIGSYHLHLLSEDSQPQLAIGVVFTCGGRSLFTGPGVLDLRSAEAIAAQELERRALVFIAWKVVFTHELHWEVRK